VLTLLATAACGDASEDACNDDNDCPANAWCNIQEDASEGTCRDRVRGSIFGDDDGDDACLAACAQLAACAPSAGCADVTATSLARECDDVCFDPRRRALVDAHADDACPAVAEIANEVFDGWYCAPDDTVGGESYRYVLLEDLSESSPTGDTPGADIDAVAIDMDGVEFYASGVEDFEVSGANNNYIDPNELLGPPDSGCMKQNFMSLGGAAAGSFMIVSFGRDQTFGRGDAIVVYELGPTVCPNQPTWLDDPVRVGVSISLDLGTFETIGESGEGQNVLFIP